MSTNTKNTDTVDLLVTAVNELIGRKTAWKGSIIIHEEDGLDIANSEDYCDRLGYVSKEAQIERYQEAGIRYDDWLAQNYVNGYPVAGEPDEEEDFYDPSMHKGYTEMDAIDDIGFYAARRKRYEEIQMARQKEQEAKKAQETANNAEKSKEVSAKQDSPLS